MRLLKEVKMLREEFPDLKIRQLVDAYNRKYALFVLPECAEDMTLTFEYDCMILDFYGSKSIFGYPEREFQYMVREIKNLLECRTLALVVEHENKCCGSMIVSAAELDDDFLLSAATRFCIMSNLNNPKNVFVNLLYCNSELDHTEYFTLIDTKRTR